MMKVIVKVFFSRPFVVVCQYKSNKMELDKNSPVSLVSLTNKTELIMACFFPLTDQAYVLKKCPYLINEMINVCATLVAMAMSGRGL